MSKKIRVLIQFDEELPNDHSATMDFSNTLLNQQPEDLQNLMQNGFSQDKEYGSIKVPSKLSQKHSAAFDIEPTKSSYIVRGTVENKEKLEDLIKFLETKSNPIRIFSDPQVSTCCASPGLNEPIGNSQDVQQLLNVDRLHALGMKGQGVIVVMIDTGLNLTYLNNRGYYPNLHSELSWIPDDSLIIGNADLTQPGRYHGTMGAFNVCLVAPDCQLADFPVINPPGFSNQSNPLEKLTSDIIQAYSRVIEWLEELDQESKPALVINNSWGVYKHWDYYDEKNKTYGYIDNPEHPLNQTITNIENFGADVVFAAGNCGSNNFNPRCNGETGSNTIYGANSHPKALCIVGASIEGQRLDYSSQGPGTLPSQASKPDICAYTHFRGSEVSPSGIDIGTSTACSVVTGVIAAIRSQYPSSVLSPENLRQIIRNTSDKLGEDGFDYEHGYGLINTSNLLQELENI